MLRSVLLISLTITQCITQKSQQNIVFDSVASRASVDGSNEPSNSKCSEPGKTPGSCVSIFQCPMLYELYQRSKNLSSKEIKSLRDAFCGWSQGAPFVCCGSAPPSTNDVHCGDSILKSRSKVLGGRPSKLGAWPWMAAVFIHSERTNKTSFQCGSSLISREWLLTVAHCVLGLEQGKSFHVRLGDLNINDTVQDGVSPIDVEIKEVITHPNFTQKPVHNDIALLRLSKPVEYNENIRPICLHAGKTFSQNMTLYDRKKPFITGWVTVEYLGEISNHLVEAEVQVVPLSKCTKNYERYIELKQIRIDETVVCASGPDKDSCLGDSGGPLMIIDKNYWYQIGIISTGLNCNDVKYPSVYTKVASFIDWINEKTGLNF